MKGTITNIIEIAGPDAVVVSFDLTTEQCTRVIKVVGPNGPVNWQPSMEGVRYAPFTIMVLGLKSVPAVGDTWQLVD